MERKVPFVLGEYYHVFTRGVEKRKIFGNGKDYDRFLGLLYVVNQKSLFHMGNFLAKKGREVEDVFKEIRDSENLVSVVAYSLMPNHFHLLIKEQVDGGISKFMGKLLTAYVMYFNTKYKRSGPLLVRPFRSVHVSQDIHFQHLLSYIHLNAVDIVEPRWKEKGIINHKNAQKFLDNYEYSSYPEFRGIKRNQSGIVDLLLPEDLITRAPLNIQEYESWYREYEE